MAGSDWPTARYPSQYRPIPFIGGPSDEIAGDYSPLASEEFPYDNHLFRRSRTAVAFALSLGAA